MSPSARAATSATVQGPIPRRPQSRALAASGAMPTASSSRWASVAASHTVRDRLPSTPARCQSQDGTRRQVRDLPDLQFPPEPEPGTEEEEESAAPNEPAATGISIDLQDRIRDLEQSLLEERRAFEESEERYRELERRYDELEQKLTSLGSST